MFSSKPALIRFIWVVLCVVCYGAMVYLSFTAVKTYLGNPTSTFIDVSFETVSTSFLYNQRRVVLRKTKGRFK